MAFLASEVDSARRHSRSYENLLRSLDIEIYKKDLPECFTWKYLYLSLFMSVYIIH